MPSLKLGAGEGGLLIRYSSVCFLHSLVLKNTNLSGVGSHAVANTFKLNVLPISYLIDLGF